MVSEFPEADGKVVYIEEDGTRNNVKGVIWYLQSRHVINKNYKTALEVY